MVQAGENIGFSLELAGVFVGEEEIFLDGDGNTEVLIYGVVNSSHASLSEDGEDAVAVVEEKAGREGHVSVITLSFYPRKMDSATQS